MLQPTVRQLDWMRCTAHLNNLSHGIDPTKAHVRQLVKADGPLGILRARRCCIVGLHLWRGQAWAALFQTPNLTGVTVGGALQLLYGPLLHSRPPPVKEKARHGQGFLYNL